MVREEAEALWWMLPTALSLPQLHGEVDADGAQELHHVRPPSQGKLGAKASLLASDEPSSEGHQLQSTHGTGRGLRFDCLSGQPPSTGPASLTPGPSAHRPPSDVCPKEAERHGSMRCEGT